MTTWTARIPPSRPGMRVAVKDNIDVAGLPTTCASPAVQARSAPADAECVARAKASGVVIVGKTNMHEFACGGSGINPFYGTPVNPLDPDRIPGGSSSGNAVALANFEADLAIGTDTAGSIRTPAACCGVVGLKPTWGRLSMRGVRPLAPSLDTVGPMARTITQLADGMRVLDPQFSLDQREATLVHRVYFAGSDNAFDAAIDGALHMSGVQCELWISDFWPRICSDADTVLLHEIGQTLGPVVAASPGLVSSGVRAIVDEGQRIPRSAYTEALERRDQWRDVFSDAFSGRAILAWPCLGYVPTGLNEPPPDTRSTNIVANYLGFPALVFPVPVVGSRFPASLQLVGPPCSESLIVRTALTIEARLR